jgi:hypothetical protein
MGTVNTAPDFRVAMAAVTAAVMAAVTTREWFN